MDAFSLLKHNLTSKNGLQRKGNDGIKLPFILFEKLIREQSETSLILFKNYIMKKINKIFILLRSYNFSSLITPILEE